LCLNVLSMETGMTIMSMVARVTTDDCVGTAASSVAGRK
jgi:hypothetical protein